MELTKYVLKKMQRLFSVLAEAHGAGASHGRNETTARFRRGSVRRMFFKSTASALQKLPFQRVKGLLSADERAAFAT
ncbi:hypothetical protein [Segatella baroniae]|uniref:hypothetical protein n=1 Tax=Segatella baroniae TaxID=305719 RepID=UPI0013786674|nr:hypothetical protein [Segatella baroniae]